MRSMTRQTRCEAPTPSEETVRQRLQARRWAVMVRYPIWDDDWIKQLADVDARILLGVFEATRRLERGVYGCCVRCNGMIATERLTQVPEAAICEVCAMFTELDAPSGTPDHAP
jgi:hypothetical protein